MPCSKIQRIENARILTSIWSENNRFGGLTTIWDLEFQLVVVPDLLTLDVASKSIETTFGKPTPIFRCHSIHFIEKKRKILNGTKNNPTIHSLP
jgi:hypothetical protein